ncbi:interferon gamma [Genypterus blacodes]|uniref:interferon gamma n=1 Tax=Genypterus blacodes TaxID=154954 RepID=UPI003F76D1B9
MVAMERLMVCLCMCVCVVSSFNIPAEMNRTIQNLLQHYKIPVKERFNGRPVFSMEALEGKVQDAEKRVFLGGVLETYEKLINKMMGQLPTPAPQAVRTDQRPTITSIINGPLTTGNQAKAAEGRLRDELNYILKLVKTLRKHQYREQDKVLQGLRHLQHIQMDDLIIQSKALWELPQLYQEASLLTGSSRRQRRRRRAQRVKTHLRG